jgi:hypothetical protein
MALPTGGPQGDYVSQAEYAAQQIKERQKAPQPPQQSQAAERQGERSMPDRDGEGSKPTLEERIAAENERNERKNNASRAEQLGKTPRGELTEKAQASIDAKAEKMAAEQKQDRGQDRAKEQERSHDMENSR